MKSLVCTAVIFVPFRYGRLHPEFVFVMSGRVESPPQIGTEMTADIRSAALHRGRRGTRI